MTALNARSRLKTSVTSEMRSTKTNERMRRKLSCRACRTDRKKTDALVTRRRHVAEHVELGAARALGLVLQHDRDAAGLERGAHRAADVDVRVAVVAAGVLALRGQPALELHHDAVDGGEVLGRAARQRAVELVQRPRRRQRLRALDLRALELAAQEGLELADLVAGERHLGRAALALDEALRAPSAARASGGCAGRRRRARPSPRRGGRRRRSPAGRGRAARPRRRCGWPRGSARAARRSRSARRSSVPVTAASPSRTPASSAAPSAARKK